MIFYDVIGSFKDFFGGKSLYDIVVDVIADGGKMWLLAGTHGHVVIVARRARSADRDAERPCMAADMNQAKTTTVAP